MSRRDDEIDAFFYEHARGFWHFGTRVKKKKKKKRGVKEDSERIDEPVGL